MTGGGGRESIMELGNWLDQSQPGGGRRRLGGITGSTEDMGLSRTRRETGESGLGGTSGGIGDFMLGRTSGDGKNREILQNHLLHSQRPGLAHA